MEGAFEWFSSCVEVEVFFAFHFALRVERWYLRTLLNRKEKDNLPLGTAMRRVGDYFIMYLLFVFRYGDQSMKRRVRGANSSTRRSRRKGHQRRTFSLRCRSMSTR